MTATRQTSGKTSRQVEPAAPCHVPVVAVCQFTLNEMIHVISWCKTVMMRIINVSPLVFVSSQPLVMCRQCPGYRREVSQLLFATGSNYWLPGLPAPPPLPPPPKPATEEDSAKPTGEQPSTSSDVASGDHEWRLDIRVVTFTNTSHSGAAYWFNPATSKTLLFRLSRLHLRLQPSSVSSAAPQEYRCPPQGCHLICTCCLQPMPDRRAELNPQQAQQCEWSQTELLHMNDVRLSIIKTFIVQCLSCSYLIILAATVFLVWCVCFIWFFVCWLLLLYFLSYLQV